MSTQTDATASFRYPIFANYKQVWLEDSQAQEGAGEDPGQRAAAVDALVVQLLSEEAQARHVGAAPGVVCIITARNATVPVTIEIASYPPSLDLEGWDRVIEASIEVPSGCLVLHGPTDYFPNSPRITVKPGTYRVRVSFGGEQTVSMDELEGADYYSVTLWPASAEKPTILFEKEGASAQRGEAS